jgi:ADP-ribose pyrophosphatase
VKLPDGAILDRFHALEEPPNVNIIALTQQGEVVLVEQWRHPVREVTLEFPAGVVEEGEDPLVAAKWELLEETGYVSEDWHFLGQCYTQPSRRSNRLFSFAALGSWKATDQRLGIGELIQTKILPWSKFRSDLLAGDRTIGRCITLPLLGSVDGNLSSNALLTSRRVLLH